MDESLIQLGLHDDLRSRGHLFIIPNVSWSWLMWEADLISFTRAGYMNEYEIKISKPDFERDFKKHKHSYFKRGLSNNRMPNYFWYVAPAAAFPLCVPDYAGLMTVAYHPANLGVVLFDVVRKPKLLHRAKVTDEGKLAMLNAGMMKYWNAARKLRRKGN